LEGIRQHTHAARLGSVTEAAKKNYVSQSALSQGIRSLEKDLKVELTTHQENRFVLTDTGVWFSGMRNVYQASVNCLI